MCRLALGAPHKLVPFDGIVERDIFYDGRPVGGRGRRLWARSVVVGGARGRRRGVFEHWRRSRRARKARRAAEKQSKAKRNDNQTAPQPTRCTQAPATTPYRVISHRGPASCHTTRSRDRSCSLLPSSQEPVNSKNGCVDASSYYDWQLTRPLTQRNIMSTLKNHISDYATAHL